VENKPHRGPSGKSIKRRSAIWKRKSFLLSSWAVFANFPHMCTFSVVEKTRRQFAFLPQRAISSRAWQFFVVVRNSNKKSTLSFLALPEAEQKEPSLFVQ